MGKAAMESNICSCQLHGSMVQVLQVSTESAAVSIAWDSSVEFRCWAASGNAENSMKGKTMQLKPEIHRNTSSKMFQMLISVGSFYQRVWYFSDS